MINRSGLFKIKSMKISPLDYTDKRLWVHFEVADVKATVNCISELDFIDDNIIYTEYGFNLLICNQQIPEVLRQLLKYDHAVYQVIKLDSE